MCGIAGQIKFNTTPVVDGDIRRMLDEIQHRGPDGSGVHIDEMVGLGHQRLAIIDLSEKGCQPMSDASGRYTVVFNGEMYNFKAVRRELQEKGVLFDSQTDTEVVLYLYVQYGKECVKKMNGMFALAIWDSKKKELFIARDRVGKKPLKYYIDNDSFVFASELKSILTIPTVTKEIDWTAVDQFLTHKYVPAPRTGFKNIFKLPPASYATIRKGTIDIETYWDINFSKKQTLSEAEWIERIESKLREVTKQRLFADVPLGVHLSGGVDSSLIVALAAQETKGKLTTFSIGFQEKEHDELAYARLVAEKYKTAHQERIVTAEMIDVIPTLVAQYEEPYADPSSLPTWVLSEATKKDLTVVLNGDGGDENFAGYERNLVTRLHPILKLIPGKKLWSLCIDRLRLRSKSARTAKRLFDAYDRDLYQFYENVIAFVSKKQKGSLYTSTMREKLSLDVPDPVRAIYDSRDADTRLDAFLYTGIKTFLADDLLVKVDIATMNHAVEARSPFLDYEFLELTAQMPGHFKIKGLTKKYILKKIAEKYIPAECIYRPKKGFTVPISHWMRGDMNKMLRENVLDEKFLAYGFNAREIVALLETHESGEQDNGKELWALLMLRLWLKHWFEKEPAQ